MLGPHYVLLAQCHLSQIVSEINGQQYKKSVQRNDCPKDHQYHDFTSAFVDFPHILTWSSVIAHFPYLTKGQWQIHNI